MTIALIMAGGRSERMRASGNRQHKALRLVRGRTLLAWNLIYAAGSGIEQIFVATNRDETEIIAFLQDQAVTLANDLHFQVHCLLEDKPLGTVGIIQQLAEQTEAIVILNVDNLTSIDLPQLIAKRAESDAAICIATHMETFQIPLGQVVCRDGEIIEYLEKPKLPVRISSGAYVIAPRVCRWIEPGRRLDVPELIPMAQAKGERIVAFEHDAPWIDINDPVALDRAEELAERSPLTTQREKG